MFMKKLNDKKLLLTIVREFRFMPMDLLYKLMPFMEKSSIDYLVDIEVQSNRLLALDANRRQTRENGTYQYLCELNVDFSKPNTEGDRLMSRYIRASIAGYVMAAWDVRQIYFN